MRAADTERAAATAHGVEWNHIIALASAHGLLPLLFDHAAAGHVPVPAEPFELLRARANANARRSLALAVELAEVLRTCARSGIAVLPLKGPVLAQQIYGSVGLRQIRDLDLLFRESDVAAAVRLLEARGYRMAPPPAEWARRGTHHLSGLHPERQIRIEVHHRLLMPRGARQWTLEAFEGRLDTTDFMGIAVATMRPVELFLYLCEHGANHSWSRLEWLVTLTEVARRHIDDWDEVWTAAAEWAALRRVRAALELADELLGQTAGSGSEAGVGSAPADAWIRAANSAVVRRLARDPLRVVATPLESLAYQARTDATPGSRVRRAWRTLMVPTAEDAVMFNLPQRLWRLYYILRPFRLLRRSSRSRPPGV
jgi:hypothetical protein